MTRLFVATLGGALVLVGGFGLLMQTLFGCIAILPIGFDSIAELIFAACLTLAFPLYLIGIGSLRVATLALWVFFLAQWVNECLNGHVDHPHLVNPFDWWHGDFLVTSIVLVTIGYFLVARNTEGRKVVRLGNLFDD